MGKIAIAIVIAGLAIAASNWQRYNVTQTVSGIHIRLDMITGEMVRCLATTGSCERLTIK